MPREHACCACGRKQRWLIGACAAAACVSLPAVHTCVHLSPCVHLSQGRFGRGLTFDEFVAVVMAELPRTTSASDVVAMAALAPAAGGGGKGRAGGGRGKAKAQAQQQQQELPQKDGGGVDADG